MSADVYIFTDLGDGTHEWGELNITYNLTPMLLHAGFKGWSEHQKAKTSARRFGLNMLMVLDTFESAPDHFRRFDSPNRWGTYDSLMPVLRRFCRQVPWHRNDLSIGYCL